LVGGVFNPPYQFEIRKMMDTLRLALLLLLWGVGSTVEAFNMQRPRVKGVRYSVNPNSSPLYAAKKKASKGKKATKKKSASSATATVERPRSRVVDTAGPTPELEVKPLETVNVEDIKEWQYDPKNHPIPHQPWRRGETAGCEDPIDAPWRRRAEKLIYKAVELTGIEAMDVTWYLTTVRVTIPSNLTRVQYTLLKDSGPVINWRKPRGMRYYDPDDPEPEDIWEDEDDDPVYTRDVEREQELKDGMYDSKEADDKELELPEDLPHLYKTQETRLDEMWRNYQEALIRTEKEPVTHPAPLYTDTMALSTVAEAILNALESEEDELKVLERHELVLTSPGTIEALETQKQFDEARGKSVLVETKDPWDSNRTLKGTLIDRNSMDVYINVKGRMVTIPLNFVSCVRLKDPSTNILTGGKFFYKKEYEDYAYLEDEHDEAGASYDDDDEFEYEEVEIEEEDE
jgi:hypothetical protein